MWKTMDEATLKSKKVADLREIAKTFGLKGYEKMRKADLIAALMIDEEPAKEETEAKAAEPEAKAYGRKYVDLQRNKCQSEGERQCIL